MKPDGAGHDIFAPGCAPMPVVLALRRIPRSQIRPQAGLAVPRGGLGPRRRTVTSWIRTAGLSTQFRLCYTTVAAADKKAKDIAARLVCEVVKPLVADLARLTLALDDTPTQRYGPFVQGAGIHHNPTPDPAAGSPHVYSHIWVVLGLLAVHLVWGVIACHFWLACLSGRRTCPRSTRSLGPSSKPSWRWLSSCSRWVHSWLKYLSKPLWVVVNGAYAKAPFLEPAMSLGMTVVSRLRKNAALWTVPVPRVAGYRQAADLRGEPHRAGQACRTASRLDDRVFKLYGKPAKKRCKTFVATWHPGRRPDPVVLADDPDGWVAYFCTDPNATVTEILATVADRFAAVRLML